jgi:hypothetical protein
MDCRCEIVFDVDLSPFSRTPNSLMDASPGVGDGSVEPGARLATLRLARRSIIPEFFSVGEPTADVRLEMRGILVGVSFIKALSNDDGGMSFGSLDVCEPIGPTEGDPAIVGSWPRPRREASACFCAELAVWAVSLEEAAVVVRVEGLGVDKDELDDEDFKLATR